MYIAEEVYYKTKDVFNPTVSLTVYYEVANSGETQIRHIKGRLDPFPSMCSGKTVFLPKKEVTKRQFNKYLGQRQAS